MVFDWLAADVGKTPAECASLFADWQVVYHEEAGDRVAAALMKGTEVHLIVAPEWRGKLIQRHRAIRFAAGLLDKNGGMLTTRILHGSSGAIDFVERVGFVHTWSDPHFRYYALCRVPFQRSPKQ